MEVGVPFLGKLLGVFLSLFLGLFQPTLAKELDSVVVIGTEIAGLLEDGQSGPYNEIYDMLTTGYTRPVAFNVAPIKRAIRLFAAGRANCLYVGSDDPTFYARLGLSMDEVIISTGIYGIRIRIYSAKGSAPIESNPEVRNKVIAMDVGVGSVEHVAHMMGHPQKQALTAQTLAQGFQMLDKGRVAGLVAIDTDVKYLQLKDPRYKGYSVSRTFSVQKGDDVLVCRRSSGTETFMAHVNTRIDTLKASGAIQRVLSNSFLGQEGRR